jgi:hypothetical protein
VATRAEVVKFLKGQRSIHLYKNLQIALADVLSAMPDKNYRYLTENLIIIALHKTALGQAMFFPNPKGEIKLIEFHYRKELPLEVLRYVAAHELGHLMYGQLMPKKGHTWDNLEGWADEWAKEWGFSKTKKIKTKLARLR